jgi:hypothetical protein
MNFMATALGRFPAGDFAPPVPAAPPLPPGEAPGAGEPYPFSENRYY